jgi:hypothetical protein
MCIMVQLYEEWPLVTTMHDQIQKNIFIVMGTAQIVITRTKHSTVSFSTGLSVFFHT